MAREVRANLVYREFTRIGAGKVPDDKTISRLAAKSVRRAVEKLHQRAGNRLGKKVAREPQDAGRHHGRGNQHTLSDRQQFARRWGARAHAGDEAGQRGGRCGEDASARPDTHVSCGCWRSPAPAATRVESGKKKLKDAYRGLLEAASRVVGQAKQIAAKLAGIKRRNRKSRGKARQPTGGNDSAHAASHASGSSARAETATPGPKARSSACLNRRRK